MGLFGFIKSVAGTAVRTALLPVAVVKDIVDSTNGAVGQTNTGEQIDKILEDTLNLPDKLTED